MLARGNADPLAELARRELVLSGASKAARRRAPPGRRLVGRGAAPIAAAAKARDPHAAFWYQQAAERLPPGPEKAMAQKRLAAAGAVPAKLPAALMPTEFPPAWRSRSDFARIVGAGKIAFAAVPVLRFAIDIELTVPAAYDGVVNFWVDDGNYGVILAVDTPKNSRPETAQYSLSAKLGGWFYPCGSLAFPLARRSRISLVVIDLEKMVMLNGTRRLYSHIVPLELLSLRSEGNCACIIHSLTIREPNEAEYESAGLQSVNAYSAPADARTAARVAEQTAGLADRPEPQKPFMIPSIQAAMRWAPPGEFSMGDDLPDDKLGRGPRGPHRVRITHGFWITQYETTQGQWHKLFLNNPSCHQGSFYLPVNGVDWDEAVRFCEQLDASERGRGRIPPGYQYRLPTEAEWEYAALAGDRAIVPPTEKTAWYGPSSGGRPHEVGELPANPGACTTCRATPTNGVWTFGRLSPLQFSRTERSFYALAEKGRISQRARWSLVDGKLV